jgi:diguanylate cyclase (GGDEF)-like protein
MIALFSNRRRSVQHSCDFWPKVAYRPIALPGSDYSMEHGHCGKMNSFEHRICEAENLISQAIASPLVTSPVVPIGVEKTIEVLLIEDDDLDATMLIRALRKQTVPSIEVDRVRRMSEAIEKLQKHDYSIALVDINLPDSSGAESFEKLRAFDARLPIVVLTGFEDDELAIHSIRSGAQDYICKGNFSDQAIIRAIRFAIVRQEMSLGYQAVADNDHLTGMPNRRKLDENFSSLQRQTAEQGKSFCIALIDIDHFKNINNSHGHCIGDAVLRAVAGVLMQSSGEETWVGRFGGEEFAFLLPNYSLPQAGQLMQTVLDELAALELVFENTPISVTASAGLIAVSATDQWEDAFKKCDRLLYQAKNNGRNRLETTEPLEAI